MQMTTRQWRHTLITQLFQQKICWLHYFRTASTWDVKLKLHWKITPSNLAVWTCSIPSTEGGTCDFVGWGRRNANSLVFQGLSLHNFNSPNFDLLILVGQGHIETRKLVLSAYFTKTFTTERGRKSLFIMIHRLGPIPDPCTVLYVKLECGPNIGGALCSTPQSLADAHY